MKAHFILPSVLIVAVCLSAACKKRETTPGATPITADPAPDSATAPPSPRGPGPMAPPPVSVVIPDTGDVNATLGQLSLELRKYVVRTRTVPKTFQEFLAKSNVQPPPAPAGKKYAIQ